jgi:hypothetical protein
VCIARLGSVDRVAKFVLDCKTVGRRASIEGLDAPAVEILAERSAFPLPEVVAQAVAEWDVGCAPLRSYVGAAERRECWQSGPSAEVELTDLAAAAKTFRHRFDKVVTAQGKPKRESGAPKAPSADEGRSATADDEI